MKTVMWFLLSCKRYLRKPSFLMILLLFPVGAFFAGQVQKKGDRDIRIAICVEESGDNQLGNALADRLVNREQGQDAGMFRFYRCGGEAELEADVASRRAECGYVVYGGLEEKLDSGQYKRSIGVYSAPSTVAASLSTETVFAALMEMYDKELLTDYVAGGDLLWDRAGDKTGGSWADGLPPEREAARLYDKWLDNGSTFRFEYNYLGQEEDGGISRQGGEKVFLVRGLAAVYVFVTGLYGAVMVCGDEKKGLFLPLPYRLRIPCRLAALAAPAFMASASGLLALWAGRGLTSAWREIAAMAAYCVFIIALSWIFKAVCRRPEVLCCLIPFLIIGSLVFCPVFVDAGRFIGGLDRVGRLFPPWYYLRMFR